MLADQLDELCALQTKLTRMNNGLYVRPNAGIGSPAERAVLDGVERFVQQEQLIRYAYQYDECIWGDRGCGQQPFIRCLACSKRELV